MQELCFAGTVYVYNCSLPANIFISDSLGPVSFEHLVLAPLCEPKSHHIIAVHIRVPIEKNLKNLKNTLNLFPNVFRYFQIFLNNIQLY